MVKRFNKLFKGSKPFEINDDTEKFIMYGLAQRDNILLRDESNYETIAVKLYDVLVNDKNMKNKNKSKVIDLNKIYDIIYNKTKLNQDNDTFLALNLEIISQIETKKSCLMAVNMLESGDILNKYFKNIQKITSKKVINEFDEYGLNYAYPLKQEIYENLQSIIDNKCSLTDILGFLTKLQRKQKIYTNYKTMNMILTYTLNSFYF